MRQNLNKLLIAFLLAIGAPGAASAAIKIIMPMDAGTDSFVSTGGGASSGEASFESSGKADPDANPEDYNYVWSRDAKGIIYCIKQANSSEMPNGIVTHEFDGVTYTAYENKNDAANNAAQACTSNITNMASMPWPYDFNENISHWDVGSVTDMSRMFYYADAFNKDIGNWHTGNVTNMSDMFAGAQSFNQPIGNWDTGNVTNINSMFYDASSFNQPIGNWNTSNVTNMRAVFEYAEAFNQNIGGWDISNIKEMPYMFNGASSWQVGY